MLTIERWLTSDGKFPDRAKIRDEKAKDKKAEDARVSELDLARANAALLVERINLLFEDLGIEVPEVSSGFRPSAVNAAIPNAARKSLHMTGLAIDFRDADGKLDELFSQNDALLKKYGLWQEHPDATKGWAHLDLKDRGPRAKNQFRP